MTQEKLSELRQEYLNHITSMAESTGGVFPHLTIFAEDSDKKSSIIHIPVPDQFMHDDDGKDEFVNDILPEIAKKVKEEFTSYGVAWSSECWMRRMDKDKITEDWKELPKKEVVFVSIETDDKTEVVMYDIIRDGIKVDKDGDMIEDVKLNLISQESVPEKMAGRFSGLLKKFKKND